MSTVNPLVYADDPDAHVIYPVTNTTGDDLDFAPMVAIGPGEYVVEASWVTALGPTRDLKVPLAGLTGQKTYDLYLQVPAGNDLLLGSVWVADRA